MNSIPFKIPEIFLERFANGSLELYGAILKDAATGQIVGHVQQTGMLESLLRSSDLIAQTVTTSLNPLGTVLSGVGSVANTIQLSAINEKMANVQNTLSVVQGVSIAGLATSVVGIGVSIASTAVILNRLNGLSAQIDAISSRLDGLPSAIEENRIRERLTTLRTQVERFGSRDLRNESGPVVARVEETLHETYNQFSASLSYLSQKPNGDAELFKVLVAGLGLSGRTLVQALLAMNETSSALDRSRSQSANFQEIAWLWPHDKIANWARLEKIEAEATFSLFEANLAQQSTQPLIVKKIADEGYQGAQYLAAAEQEQEEPLLVLPHND